MKKLLFALPVVVMTSSAFAGQAYDQLMSVTVSEELCSVRIPIMIKGDLVNAAVLETGQTIPQLAERIMVEVKRLSEFGKEKPWIMIDFCANIERVVSRM